MTLSTAGRLLARVLLAAVAAAPVCAQPGSGEEMFVKSERKAFSVDVLTYQGDSAGLTRVDLYVEIPYNSLQFVNQGGYGEMAVVGTSIECEPIDDGGGGRYVFNRVGYCKLECNDNPTLPGCENCSVGGSGSF